MKIEYTLKRSKRRTIGIIIKDGNVSVCAPFSASLKAIENFVCSKQEWISEKIDLYNTKTAYLSDYLRYKKIMYLGGDLAPIFDNVKNISISNNQLLIPQKYDINSGKIADNVKLLNALIKFFVNDAKSKLLVILQKAALKCNRNFVSFKLTNAKTKWGSCDNENNITLNWRLIFFDEDVIEYVAIHELSHTLQHNHSKAFWANVVSYCPKYKNHKKKLKDFSMLISLFR